MDHTKTVKEAIDIKHKSSNGSCGTLIPDLAISTGIPYEELYPVLRVLYDQKYFVMKQGINGKMIFKRK
ncbi:hypothetical protein [Flavobacterium caseinilyticum]|uniref:Uncharacterized protein n=1 Tax=Flavobacterium caseinilyticum TaxID=2541732 RepID=A0A4R5AZ41_9FLAO|nr:hypothetical protein [Flavobacterium caseinilyticum]TDD77116.1 hypothetical protein E0F89_05825 [Flavobacterium caseinilyticum]